MDIEGCIKEGFLARIRPDSELVKKELAESNYDLEMCKKAYKDGDYKWCIVKSYYCMFHASRAVLFSLGLREKRHFAIGVVLEELYKKGKLESSCVNDFQAAMSSREGADYHYAYSEHIALHSMNMAEGFLARMKSLLKEEKAD